MTNGHAGDSRAILCRGGKAINLTSDHTIQNPQEGSTFCMKFWTENYLYVFNDFFVISFYSLVFPLKITRSIADFMFPPSSTLEEPQDVVETFNPTTSSTSVNFSYESRNFSFEFQPFSLSFESYSSSCSQLTKPKGLIAYLEISEYIIQNEDEFVILTSDGLWDVISPQNTICSARFIVIF